jgi:PPK2 family polyphosphate:nucleotide phosphotransferase
MTFTRTIVAGERLNLELCDPGYTAHLTEERAEKRLKDLHEELHDMQELLYGARQNALLVVLQGMDTSGKDGTIKNVMEPVDPQGCRVESFKVPTEDELAHDFLWRVHRVVPPKGMITIFNRSHYEDVLVVRVHELAPRQVWQKRYAQIRAFEKLLADTGTIVLKFFLHISREEQKKRLTDREKDPEKAWKLSAGDWRERRLWPKYVAAYEDAISRCSTEWAPWHIVPANRKWFRNVAVAEAIVEALRPYRKSWEESLRETARQKLAELQELKSSTNLE